MDWRKAIQLGKGLENVWDYKMVPSWAPSMATLWGRLSARGLGNSLGRKRALPWALLLAPLWDRLLENE
jgi:hypothetical protein